MQLINTKKQHYKRKCHVSKRVLFIITIIITIFLPNRDLLWSFLKKSGGFRILAMFRVSVNLYPGYTQYS